MRQLIGCGILLITLGILGFITPLLGGSSSNRAVWQAFEIFSEMVGSMKFASGLVIAIGISFILIGLGYEEYRQSKRDEELRK